jgi:hypothetical protein
MGTTSPKILPRDIVEAMQNQPQDMNTVIAAFMAALPKRDHQAIFKMFAPDGSVTDFEQNAHRAASLQGFFRDWPPRTMMVKLDKQQIVDRMATITITLTGGGFVKPTPAKLTMMCNDKWLIRSLRMDLGQ